MSVIRRERASRQQQASVARMTVELVRPPVDWRHDPHKVADLGRWLEDRCYFRTAEERWTFIDKLERPGNDELYDEMVREEREEERRRMFEDEAFAELERRYQ